MMKNFKLGLVLLLGLLGLLAVGCKDDKVASDVIRFSTCADYPPFEYYEHGKLVGFDIDVAHLIAKELGKEAVFEDQEFSGVLATLATGQVDAAIATIEATDERKKNFDFSSEYYSPGLVAVFKKTQPIVDQSDLPGKKIACQLGSTMEIWLKQHLPEVQVSIMDSSLQAIEALKAGHVDVVLIDAVQGDVFVRKNSKLSYAMIAKADSGCAIALQKNSPLKAPIDAALAKLEATGAMQKLKEKWLESSKWKS